MHILFEVETQEESSLKSRLKKDWVITSLDKNQIIKSCMVAKDKFGIFDYMTIINVLEIPI